MECKRLKWVWGNKLTLRIPLETETMTTAGSEVSQYVPQPGDVIKVILTGYKQHIFTPSVSGNVLIVEDNGTLDAGSYDVTVLITEAGGEKRRSRWNRVLEIVNSNKGVCGCTDFGGAEGGLVSGQYEPVRWVKGNRLQLSIPMTLRSVTESGETESAYVPSQGATVRVVLVGERKYEYTPVIDGNVLRIDDDGELGVGMYDIVVLVTEGDGTKRRSKWESVVEICEDNRKVLDKYNEFSGDVVETRPFPFTEGGVVGAGVFFFARGVDDYNELRNKPEIPNKTSQLQNDSGFLTQHQSLAGYATQQWVTSQGYLTSHQSLANYYTRSEVDEALDDKADVEDIPSLEGYATQQWVGQQGYITSETDPTVPAWAKQSTKPTYTAQEVGALPASTTIPTKTSDLTNDSGFLTQHQSLSGYATEQWVEGKGYLTSYTETDPTVPSWAKQSSKPTYTAQEVGALPSSTSIPTKTSDLTNDAGFLTQHQDISGKLDVDATAKKAQSIPFAVVDSTSTSTKFTATVPGITELVDGTAVILRNSVVTSASGFTININGLGAHPAFSNMTLATAETTIFNINYTMLFVYCANVTVGSVTGAWCCYRGYDANTNTIGYQVRTNSSVRTVTDTARYYKLYFTSANTLQWVPASVNSSNNVTTARTPNQRPIDPFGPIVFTSANSNYTSGSNLAATTIWQQYVLNLGYSFGSLATSMSSNKPVYLKCAPQSDGSAIIDSTTPIVQALPSTEDGKIYIFLGIAYSATNIELNLAHPVYYYKDSAIRLWTNQVAGGGSITIDSTPTSGSSNAVSSGGVYTALAGKAEASSLATVATSGSYDDLDDKPTIPTVPSNVSAFNNDAGYLTQHQSLTNYVQKSNTTGLLKNDGTVDTNTYLTQHQSLSGYATQTWVGQQGFLTSHQDISGKESTSNKVTSLSSSSTDTQYPSAKCVYDVVGDIQTALTAILS